jgi:hypothetical protein
VEYVFLKRKSSEDALKDQQMWECNFKRCVILIKRRVDAVKRFYLASFMCLEQATTWILSLYMFPFFTLYSESRGERWLFALLKLVEMLTSLNMKHQIKLINLICIHLRLTFELISSNVLYVRLPFYVELKRYCYSFM